MDQGRAAVILTVDELEMTEWRKHRVKRGHETFKEGYWEGADRGAIMRGEVRTPHNVISKEQRTKVSEKPTDRKRWRMKERRNSCCRISVVTFSDY